MGPDAMILGMLSFKPNFSLSFIFIKRLFSSYLLSAIRVMSSAYLRLLIFLPAILIPACACSSPAFLAMCSAYKLAWAATILRLDRKEMGTCAPWNWRLTVSETTKMMLVRPLMNNLKMTVRYDCAVSACNPSPDSIYENSHPLLWTDVSLWTDVCHPSPTPQLLASEIKQTFFSTNLACLLAFEQQAVRLHTHTLSVTMLHIILIHISQFMFFVNELLLAAYFMYILDYKNYVRQKANSSSLLI